MSTGITGEYGVQEAGKEKRARGPRKRRLCVQVPVVAKRSHEGIQLVTQAQHYERDMAGSLTRGKVPQRVSVGSYETFSLSEHGILHLWIRRVGKHWSVACEMASLRDILRKTPDT
ncbi:MAG: hypothetical protein M1399_03765 [Actinobacteria bacterium]|nr:hypothetical protein [Actinomycetota bacterium]MCL5447506.1 hypothetical protein [Actinomycetota bacterium]